MENFFEKILDYILKLFNRGYPIEKCLRYFQFVFEDILRRYEEKCTSRKIF